MGLAVGGGLCYEMLLGGCLAGRGVGLIGGICQTGDGE